MTTPTEREFAVEVVRGFRPKRATRHCGPAAASATSCLARHPRITTWRRRPCPEQVRRLFRRTVGVGEAFLVVEILGPRTETGPLKVQAATFRSDGEYIDERRPVEVVASTPREDALHRDFTINGMFFDPLENRIINYVGGQDGPRDRVLRPIGDAEKRIGEDKLPMMRAARMAAPSADGRAGHGRGNPQNGARHPGGRRQAHRGRVPQDAGGSPSSSGGCASSWSWAWRRRCCRSCCR